MLPEGGEKTAAGVTDEFPVPGSPPPREAWLYFHLQVP